MNYTNVLTKNTIVYPRENNEKYYTDKYLIHIIANKNFYERVIDSVEKALKYFNQCKDYYFVFYLPNYNIKKRFSGKEIKELVNTKGIEILKKNKIDQLYFFIYKNRESFQRIFKSIDNAKKHYFNVTEYNIGINPPSDYYDKNYYKTFNYGIKELLDIYKIAVKQKNNFNFPIPIFWN
jgi:hypothetical protein